MNANETYQLFWFCVKTITSAPSRIVLVLKPFPSDTRSNINSMVGIQDVCFTRKENK
jgi:hypothetical protein